MTSNFNFTRNTALEQGHLVDKMRAEIGTLSVKTAQAMKEAVTSGDMPKVMYFATTTGALAKTEQQIAEQSQTKQKSNSQTRPKTPGLGNR